MAMTKRGMKRLGLLLGVLVLGAGGVGGLWALRNTMRTSGAQQGLEEGTAAYEAGEFERSFEGLNAYVRIFLDNAEAWYMLADARRRIPLENRRHLTAAASFGTRAIEVDPAHIKSYDLLLDVYPQLGHYLEASRVAQALLEREPSHIEAMWVLIQSQSVLGNRQEAIQHAQRMIELAPQDMRPRRAVLDIMGLLGASSDELIAQSDGDVSQDPGNLKLLLLHTELLYRFGKSDEATAALAKARELGIEDAESLALFVTLLDQSGLRDDAEQIILDAQDNPATADASRGIQLERLWKQGRAIEAQQLLQTLNLDEQTSDDTLLGWAAIVAQGQGDTSTNTMLQHLTRRSTSRAQFWRDAVHTLSLMQHEQWAQALQVLQSLSPIMPESERELVEYWTGVCMRAIGEGSRAVDSFKSVLRSDPTWDQPAIALAQTLLEMNRLVEAFSIARGRLLTAQHPERDLVTAQIVTRMIEEGLLRSQEAEQVRGLLEQSAREDSTDGTIHALLARAQLAMGQTQQAQQTIANILSQNRTLNPGAIRQLHSAMTNAGLSTAALSTRFAAQHPNNADATFILAMESANAGRLDEGKALFRDAIEQNNTLSMQRAFAAFLDKTQDTHASEQFRLLSDTFPESARAQQDVLDSGAAWLDEQLIQDAVNRLQVLTGSQGMVWRVFEARRLLVFHRDAEHASDASLLLRELVRQNPPFTPALGLMADAMFVLGNENEGIEFLERVAINEASQPQHYPPLIEHLQRAGRLADAERWLRDYLQLDGLTLAQRQQRAAMLVSQGLWGAALPELRALAALGDPNDLVRLAQAHMRRNEPQEAQRALQQVLDSPQAQLAHWAVAADFYASQGNLEDGLATLDRAPTQNETQASLMRGALYEKHGSPQEAGAYFQQAARSDTSGDAWKDYISFFIRNLDMDSARAALQEALSQFSAHEGLLALQEILGPQSDSMSTEQIAQMAEALGSNINPEAVQALLQATDLYRTSNGSQESLIALQSVVDEYTWFFSAWRTWIFALVAKNDQEHAQQAVDASRRALTALPNEPRIASLVYEVFMQSNLFNEAASAAQEWKLRSPTNAFSADIAYASAMQSQGAFATALDALEPWSEKLITEHVDQPDYFALYAALLVQAGRASESEALLQPLASQDMRWARTMLQVARSLPAEQAARQRWYEFLEPRFSEPGDVLQLVLFAHESGIQLGDWWFQRVLEKAPTLLENPNARFDALRFLAAAEDQLGRPTQAIDYYKQAIELQPQDAVSLNNLAYLMLSSGDSLEEAQAFAQRAISVEQPVAQQVSFHDTLGEILLAQHKLEEAQNIYQQGLALESASMTMRLGLAEIHIARSEKEDAVLLLNQIRDAGGFPIDSPFAQRYAAARTATDAP